MPSAVRLREDYWRKSFAGWPAGRRTSTRAAGFCRWQGFETEWIGARRRRSGAWTARPCATGSIASTFRGRRASSTTGRMVPSSPFGGATGSVGADRRGRPGSREGRRRTLAADRPQARHRREVRRRLSSALCREAFWRSSGSPTSARGPVIRRRMSGSSRLSKTYGPPRRQEVCRDQRLISLLQRIRPRRVSSRP